MGPGTQLTAPNGLGPLVAGITYYVLATRAPVGSILFCWYEPGKGEWHVHFTRIERSLFEAALLDARLVPVKKQATLPPWLPNFEGADIHALEDKRISSKVSYAERCEQRYKQITTLVERHADIVGAENPMQKIKLIANSEDNKQKPARLALWYTAYYLFRRSMDALLPAFGGIGKWLRGSDDHKDTKTGRPNEAQGELSGYSALPLVDRIVDSFFRHAHLTVPMTAIYGKAMVKDFGCDVRTDERGIHSFYHPKGLPFPSYWQYRYWVDKELGLRTIHARKLGATTYRNKKPISEGPFSESVAHAFERTETDGYYSKVVPSALLTGAPDLPLVTCRLLCLATGMRVGVGWAHGAENAQAYRSMLFCAAVNKQRFAKLIGLEIGPNDFPCEGLPLSLVADRGPGAGRKAGPSTRTDWMPDRGMTPSYTPQSKGSVESSHRREAQVSGPPSYVQSNLTAIELARREFLQAVTDNKCSDASSRLTPDMVADNVPANPLAIFRWMQRRGRVDAYSIPFEAAVREFLEPVKFTLDANGLWFLSQRYDSESFAGTAIRRRTTKGQRVTIKGYVLPLCVRTTWIETAEGLIEVDAQLQLRDDASQLYRSLPELEVYSRKHKKLKAENRAQAPAARAAGAIAFEKQTGKNWDGGKRKSGKRPSRSSRRGRASPPRGGHARKR